MAQIKNLIQENFAGVGEAISRELGAKMVKDYQDANPDAQESFQIGRNILDQLLSQPGCAGLRLFNGLDENGQVSLVYVGVDVKGHPITEYTVIREDGKLSRIEGLIGDRSAGPGGGSGDGGSISWF